MHLKSITGFDSYLLQELKAIEFPMLLFSCTVLHVLHECYRVLLLTLYRFTMNQPWFAKTGPLLTFLLGPVFFKTSSGVTAWGRLAVVDKWYSHRLLCSISSVVDTCDMIGPLQASLVAFWLGWWLKSASSQPVTSCWNLYLLYNVLYTPGCQRATNCKKLP